MNWVSERCDGGQKTAWIYSGRKLGEIRRFWGSSGGETRYVKLEDLTGVIR